MEKQDRPHDAAFLTPDARAREVGALLAEKISSSQICKKCTSRRPLNQFPSLDEEGTRAETCMFCAPVPATVVFTALRLYTRRRKKS